MKRINVVTIILINITYLIVSILTSIVATLITQESDLQEHLWLSVPILGLFLFFAVLLEIWHGKTNISTTNSQKILVDNTRKMKWTFFLEWICIPWLITMLFSCIQTSFIVAYQSINNIVMNYYGFNILIVYIMSSSIRYIILKSYNIRASWFIYTTFSIYSLLTITYINIHNSLGVVIVFINSMFWVLIETFILPIIISQMRHK